MINHIHILFVVFIDIPLQTFLKRRLLQIRKQMHLTYSRLASNRLVMNRRSVKVTFEHLEHAEILDSEIFDLLFGL